MSEAEIDQAEDAAADDAAGPVAAVPLVYAAPRDAVRAMSRFAAGWVLVLSGVPMVIGVAILVVYRLTALESLPMLGFFWLIGGGAVTFSLGVIAVVNLVRATHRRPTDPVVVRRYGWTIVSCGIAVAVAYGCARLGSYWMDLPHFALTVTNATATPLDRVVVHFSGGSVDAGPVPARQSVRVGRVWTRQQGPLGITTTVRGLSRRKADRPSFNIYTSPGNGTTRPVEVIVEEAELPKATGNKS